MADAKTIDSNAVADLMPRAGVVVIYSEATLLSAHDTIAGFFDRAMVLAEKLGTASMQRDAQRDERHEAQALRTQESQQAHESRMAKQHQEHTERMVALERDDS